MDSSHAIPCGDVIRLGEKCSNLEKDLSNFAKDIKSEIKTQNRAISHNDSLIGEIHSDNKKILKVLDKIQDEIRNIPILQNEIDNVKNRIDTHEKKHEKQSEVKGNRNWGLIMLAVSNGVALFGFVTYIVFTKLL